MVKSRFFSGWRYASLRQLSIVGFLFGTLAPSLAQTPSPAQMGITSDTTPNAVTILDSSHTWATIGYVNPVTHVFSPAGLPPLVSSFNTRTGAVVLNSTDVTTALGFTPIPVSGAPVQSVATRTGAVTLAHTDITDWAATLLPYALLNSPAFTGTPSLPTGTTGVTQTAGDNSTKLATTAFVGSAVTAGAYTLPTASTTVLGGVKVDGSTINISGGVISGTPPAITANSTPTSGFTAGQLVMSDGAKVQNVGVGFGAVNLGTAAYPVYMGGATGPLPGVWFSSQNYPNAYGIGIVTNSAGALGYGFVANSNGFFGFNASSNYITSYPDVALVFQGLYNVPIMAVRDPNSGPDTKQFSRLQHLY